MLFKSNGDLVTDEGATKCSSSDPQTKTTKWELISGKRLVLIDGIERDTTTMVNLTDNALELTETKYGYTVDYKLKK